MDIGRQRLRIARGEIVEPSDLVSLGIATKSNREIFITNSLKDEIIKLN
jgi:hypothetical protein